MGHSALRRILDFSFHLNYLTKCNKFFKDHILIGHNSLLCNTLCDINFVDPFERLSI